MFTDEEQERCKSIASLLSVLNGKSKPQHNETILLLQYCKLSRDENDSAEEWMGCLGIKIVSATIKSVIGN